MKNTNLEQPASVEQILQTIRGVIIGDEEIHDDVLELTDAVDENGAVVTVKNPNDVAEMAVIKASDNAIKAAEFAAKAASLVSRSAKEVAETKTAGEVLKASENATQAAKEAARLAEEAAKAAEEANKAANMPGVSKDTMLVVERAAKAAKDAAKSAEEAKSGVEEVNKLAKDKTASDAQEQKGLDGIPKQQVEAAAGNKSGDGNKIGVTHMVEEQPETVSDDIAGKQKKATLISQEAANVAASSLKSLVKSVQKPHSDGLAFRGGATVEDLVVEIMRPYLREWLDRNLPGIVKHIVEKEVQKLIPEDEEQ